MTKKRRQLTQAEARHMAQVVTLGCLVCRGPAEIHHIREGAGMGQRNGHFLTIPLCPYHHRGPLSVHGSPAKFRMAYGGELELLDQTLREVAECYPS